MSRKLDLAKCWISEQPFEVCQRVLDSGWRTVDYTKDGSPTPVKANLPQHRCMFGLASGERHFNGHFIRQQALSNTKRFISVAVHI